MILRLLRVIVGLLLVITLPINLIIFILIWIITDNFYFENIMNWIIFEEFDRY